MSCSVSFLDGPKAGKTHTFNGRNSPPTRVTVTVPSGTVVYVAEPSPYPQGPAWIYLTESESPVEP